VTEGRQERSSPRAFVRSSHDKRIDLFEVGEASTVRPVRLRNRACRLREEGHSNCLIGLRSRRDSDLQSNKRRHPNFDRVSLTSDCNGQDVFLRSPRDFEASAYSAAVIAPPDLGSVRKARVLRGSTLRFDRANIDVPSPDDRRAVG